MFSHTLPPWCCFFVSHMEKPTLSSVSGSHSDMGKWERERRWWGGGNERGGDGEGAKRKDQNLFPDMDNTRMNQPLISVILSDYSPFPEDMDNRPQWPMVPQTHCWVPEPTEHDLKAPMRDIVSLMCILFGSGDKPPYHCLLTWATQLSDQAHLVTTTPEPAQAAPAPDGLGLNSLGRWDFTSGGKCGARREATVHSDLECAHPITVAESEYLK